MFTPPRFLFITLSLIGMMLTMLGCHPGSHTNGHGGHGHGGHGHGGHGGHEGEHAHHGPEPLSETSFSAHTELFLEYPPLVVGERSRFAAHMTALKRFKPVITGHMTVELTVAGDTQRFEVIKPTEPGIFRPVVIPGQAGPAKLKLTLKTDQGLDVHDLGSVHVYDSAEDAATERPSSTEGDGAIALLKEQQWALELSTTPVRDARVRPSFPVYGTVEASQGRELMLTAPAAGKVVALADGVSKGARITEGQLLASLAPQPEAGQDTPALQASLRQARLNLNHARNERQRLEALFTAGAVPKRRLEEAVHHEELAQVKLSEAAQRLRMHQRSVGGQAGAVEVRAPANGVLIAVDVTQGQSVEEGATLFKFLDSDTLWIEARVPEFDLPGLTSPASGWLEHSSAVRLELNQREIDGGPGIVDPSSRTAPLRFALDEAGRRLHPGASVMLNLYSGAPRTGAVVPRTAVLSEGGQDVVFIQRSGETFERRPVRLGAFDLENVLVKEGVTSGERVVSKGAYLVKLAASSTQVPDHGHAH